MTDPVIDALERVREIDAAYVAAHPSTADFVLDRRMRDLRLTLAAAVEIARRNDELGPDAIRAEMRVLEPAFVFAPELFLEFAEGFRDDGDDVNAETCARAYAWHARMAEPSI